MNDTKTHGQMMLRLPMQNWRLLETLARQLGMTKTAVIGQSLRALAKAEGIAIPSEEEKEAAT